MIATVRYIQVGGIDIHQTLLDACKDYINSVECGGKEKIQFCITLPNGEVKYITIRQEEDKVVAYGNFEGLPDFLQYAKEVAGNPELS